MRRAAKIVDVFMEIFYQWSAFCYQKAMSPMVLIFIAYSAGVLAGKAWPIPPGLLLYWMALSTGFAGYGLWQGHGRRLVPLFLLVSSFCLGDSRCVLRLFPLNKSSLDPWIYEQGEGLIRVEGRVLPYPVSKPGEKEPSCRFLLRCSNFQSGDQTWHPVVGTLRVVLCTEHVPRTGTQVRLRGWLAAPAFPRNPGGFDYASILRCQGVAGSLYVRNQKGFEKMAGPDPWSPWPLFERLYMAISRSVGSGLRDPERGLALALLIGERTGIDDETNAVFSKAGITHILSVSGLHVMAIAMGLRSGSRLLTRNRLARTVIPLAGMFFYVCLVGFMPPIVRSAVMASVFFMGNHLEKPPHGLSSLGLAGLLILYENPLSLFQVGFQFSFASVAGILLFHGRLSRLCQEGMARAQKVMRGNQIPEEPLKKALERAGLISPEEPERAWLRFLFRLFQRTRSWPRRLVRSSLSMMLVTLSAQLSIFPLAVRNFQTVSLLASTINVLVVPLVPLLMGSSITAGLAGALHPSIGAPLKGLVQMLCRLLIDSATLATRIPLGYGMVPQISWLQVLLLYLLILSLFIQRRKRLLMGMALTGLLLTLAGQWIERRGSLRLMFMDVGQGDCAVLRMPSGKVILIDAGPTSTEQRSEPWGYFKRRGIRTIDHLVTSHADSDHIGGLEVLLPRVRILHRIQSSQETHTRTSREIENSMQDRKIPSVIASAGQALDLDAEVRGEILNPEPSTRSEDSNQMSVVLLVHYLDHSILFTGDIDETVEQGLLRQKDLKGIDLLKVSHHGSDHSTSWSFVKEVRPQMSVVSVGRSNPYHHPSPDTLLRLNKVGGRVYRTDEQGAILVSVSHEGWQETTQKREWERKNVRPRWWLRTWGFPCPTGSRPPRRGIRIP